MHALAWAILAIGMAPGSSAEIIRETDIAGESAEISVEVRQGKDRLPVRVIVTASDGSHPDGSGHGAYADGRFFAEGSFTLKLPKGASRLQIWGGPNYEPLDFRFEAKLGKCVHLAASLHRWFSPEDRGWYAGDNHVHAQHDSTAAVKTSLRYTALQARANGLSYLTEAGSEISYDGLKSIDTLSFLFRYAPEVRIGPFIGHRNTPGIREPIPKDRYDQIAGQALPTEALTEEVHARGGAVIYTHPLTPPHLLHWMGSPEAWSNAVRGRCADAFDVDSGATELFWFALLNLGNRIAVSGSTDAALGRLQTLSPGDRRVYCRASRFTYDAFVEALRRGETFATNGGPLFPFFTLDGKGLGSIIAYDKDSELIATAEVHSLYPLHKATLIANGIAVHSFPVEGQKGEVIRKHALAGKMQRPGWYVLRVEDERGHWALTSPVYVEEPKTKELPLACGLMLESSNHTRFIELRKEYFAHLVATVSPGESIEYVELVCDGKPVKRFEPSEPNERTGGKTPVTAIDGEYGPGWLWRRDKNQPVHLQADWPMTQRGWHHLRCRFRGKSSIESDAFHFDPDHPKSQALSVLKVVGSGGRWTQWGYGEEMPLADIRQPFKGDHWWYPQSTFWRIRYEWKGAVRDAEGGSAKTAEKKFRKIDGD